MRIILILFLCSLLFAGDTETLNYSVKNGEKEVRSRWFIKKGMAELFRETEKQTYKFNLKDETTSFALKDSATNTDYSVIREGDSLIMRGIIDGEVVDQIVEIDDSPWQQSVHDLSTYALNHSDSKSHSFWLVRPVDLKVVKMKATYSRRKSTPEVITLRVAPVGVLSILWKAYYSYRISDGIFVEYRSIHGPPGTPETVVSLL